MENILPRREARENTSTGRSSPHSLFVSSASCRGTSPKVWEKADVYKRQLLTGQLFQIAGLRDFLQQRRIHKFTSFSRIEMGRSEAHRIEEADQYTQCKTGHNLQRSRCV